MGDKKLPEKKEIINAQNKIFNNINLKYNGISLRENSLGEALTLFSVFFDRIYRKIILNNQWNIPDSKKLEEFEQQAVDCIKDVLIGIYELASLDIDTFDKYYNLFKELMETFEKHNPGKHPSVDIKPILEKLSPIVLAADRPEKSIQFTTSLMHFILFFQKIDEFIAKNFDKKETSVISNENPIASNKENYFEQRLLPKVCKHLSQHIEQKTEERNLKKEIIALSNASNAVVAPVVERKTFREESADESLGQPVKPLTFREIDIANVATQMQNLTDSARKAPLFSRPLCGRQNSGYFTG